MFKSVDYRAFKAAAAQELSALTCSQSARGAVRVPGSPLYVLRDDFLAFRALQRKIALDRSEIIRDDFDQVARVELEDAAAVVGGHSGLVVEFCALVALGLNFHDDRGDGLLYVPAFHSKKFLSAWNLAVWGVLGRDSFARPCRA